jgi:hypothetical protein
MKCFLVEATYQARTAPRFWALCKGAWTALVNDSGRVTCRDCKRCLREASK